MHTFKLCISLLRTLWNCILVLTISYTGIDKIVHRYWWNHIPRQQVGLFPILVYDFVNTGKWFCQYQYMILPTRVYDFANTPIWFRQCQYTISLIPVYDFRISAMVHFWTSLRAEWKSELRCMYLNGHRVVTLPMIKGVYSPSPQPDFERKRDSFEYEEW